MSLSPVTPEASDPLPARIVQVDPKLTVSGGHTYKPYTGFTGKIMSLFGMAVKVEGDKGETFYVKKSEIRASVIKLIAPQHEAFPTLERTHKLLIETLFKTKITKEELDTGFTTWTKEAIIRMKQEYLSLDTGKLKEILDKTQTEAGRKEISKSPQVKKEINQFRKVLNNLILYPEIIASLDLEQLKMLAQISDFSLPIGEYPELGLDREVFEAYNSQGMRQLLIKTSEKLIESADKIGKGQLDKLFSHLKEEQLFIKVGNKVYGQARLAGGEDEEKVETEVLKPLLEPTVDRVRALCSKIEDVDLIKQLIQPREVQIAKHGEDQTSQADMTEAQARYGDFSSSAGGCDNIEPFLKARLKELQRK